MSREHFRDDHDNPNNHDNHFDPINLPNMIIIITMIIIIWPIIMMIIINYNPDNDDVSWANVHGMSWANDHDDYCDLDDSYCVIVIIVIMMNIVIMLIIVIMMIILCLWKLIILIIGTLKICPKLSKRFNEQIFVFHNKDLCLL